MIFNIKPVTHVGPIAIDRQMLALQRIERDNRDQLFREVIWPVIV